MGGYKIRPYGPAFSFLVGADAHIGPPAPRVRGSPPNRTHLHPHRRGGLYIRPEPGASATGLSYIAPGSGRAMRAPTVCAFDGGAFEVNTERADAHIGPPVPGYGAVRRTARTSIHTVGADYISARNRVH